MNLFLSPAFFHQSALVEGAWIGFLKATVIQMGIKLQDVYCGFEAVSTLRRFLRKVNLACLYNMRNASLLVLTIVTSHPAPIS